MRRDHGIIRRTPVEKPPSGYNGASRLALAKAQNPTMTAFSKGTNHHPTKQAPTPVLPSFPTDLARKLGVTWLTEDLARFLLQLN
ncbi:MAG: hypothetical protein ACRC8S_23200 [Fimbriiglobus sp.]